MDVSAVEYRAFTVGQGRGRSVSPIKYARTGMEDLADEDDWDDNGHSKYGLSPQISERRLNSRSVDSSVSGMADYSNHFQKADE